MITAEEIVELARHRGFSRSAWESRRDGWVEILDNGKEGDEVRASLIVFKKPFYESDLSHTNCACVRYTAVARRRVLHYRGEVDEYGNSDGGLSKILEILQC